MRKIAAALLFCSVPLHAAELNLNSVPLNGLSAADISAVKTAPPPASAPAMKFREGEVITQLHLLPQTYKNVLSASVKSEKEFAEFTKMWNPILQKAGFTIGEVSYNARLGMADIKYSSPKNQALRLFIADKLNYDALNPTEMHNLRQELTASLERNGMPVMASFYLRNDIFRPTFVLYYVTEQGENGDREKQLRIFKPGEDIDYELLQNAGVNIVRKDNSYTMAYVGNAIGSKGKLAVDEATAAQKLEEYKKLLAGQKMEFIGARIQKLDAPFTVGAVTYNYCFTAYFYY
ncbi:MAG TPA: hypothetical protein PKI19_04080 [Elusimicrobiales bacterium]|nr:hypothetical protein [Elusimicrobiales bacterium]